MKRKILHVFTRIATLSQPVTWTTPLLGTIYHLAKDLTVTHHYISELNLIFKNKEGQRMVYKIEKKINNNWALMRPHNPLISMKNEKTFFYNFRTEIRKKFEFGQSCFQEFRNIQEARE